MPIKIENVSYIYQKGSPFEKKALNDCSLTVNGGETIGIMGVTGSGKSTLLQLFNALLLPAEGSVTIDGQLTSKMKKPQLSRLRQDVALVFQYPEQQIFEEYVYDEVAFAPANLGLNAEEIEQRVAEALKQAGLRPEKYSRCATARLSGGEKRRLAMAGILALKPRYLLLDEPTAGLDPGGSRLLLDNLRHLNRTEATSIIMVSHRLDHIILLCDRILLMNQGRICLDEAAEHLLERYEILSELGIDLTPAQKVVQQLNQKGWGIPSSPRSPEEASLLISEKLKGANYV